MNPTERATILRDEADWLMQELQLVPILSRYGSVIPTGSYMLNVMAYPDIDLLVSKISIADLFSIGGQLAASKLVSAVNFKKSDDPDLPGGLYLKAQVNYGSWGRPWKIDIWSLDEEIIQRKMTEMLRFKEHLTHSSRQAIIRYKNSILTPEHRTPMYSGYFIYKAFIDEGLTSWHEITGYLASHGIQVNDNRQMTTL